MEWARKSEAFYYFVLFVSLLLFFILVGRDGLNATEIVHLPSYQHVQHHYVKNTPAVVRAVDLI